QSSIVSLDIHRDIAEIHGECIDVSGIGLPTRLVDAELEVAVLIADIRVRYTIRLENASSSFHTCVIAWRPDESGA
ncbi:hypothetical protein, partial [Burkholderia cepacia]|uniref:hypothetical protein n=1 Tax=Burkholderia cepacia TaxID=292 RepID=UPI00298FD0E7